MSSKKPGPVDPKKTFVDKINRTSYHYVLHDKLRYELYVHRAGLSGNFHHKIVLRAVEYRRILGYITLELQIADDDYSQVIAQSIIFQGDEGELEFKGYFKGSLAAMANYAMKLLRDMGEYNVLTSNCQNFCNYFLEGLKKKPSPTTVRNVAEGAGVTFVGFVLLAALKLVWKKLSK